MMESESEENGYGTSDDERYNDDNRSFDDFSNDVLYDEIIQMSFRDHEDNDNVEDNDEDACFYLPYEDTTVYINEYANEYYANDYY